MVFAWFANRRRKKILQKAFPVEWTQILEKNVAAYELLDEDERQRLRDLVQVFVAEKSWEGCGGLELDDEIRVTIAGTGCQMLLGRDHDLFHEVESILVYPSAVVATSMPRSTFDPGNRVVEDGKAVLGLAVKGGAMVLAWDSALQGARDHKDGRNVVVHELAHKIDFLDGSVDGTPELDSHGELKAWAVAFEPAYLAHKKRAEKGKKSFLDDYAVTNEAEYFAVASEAFFEKPVAMKRELPAVYAALAAFYNLDLAARAEATAARTRQVKGKPTHAKAAQAATAHAKTAHAKAAHGSKQAAGKDAKHGAAHTKTAAASPKDAKATSRATRSHAAIAVPPVDARPAPRTTKSHTVPVGPGEATSSGARSRAAIPVPPVDARPPVRTTKSHAIPLATLEEAARAPTAKSRAAIPVPPVEATASPRTAKSRAAIPVPPSDPKPPARATKSHAIPTAVLEQTATPRAAKSRAAIPVPPVAPKPPARR